MEFHPKIIIFFKKHNMYDKYVFNYLKENTTSIDYAYEEQHPLIGCFYILDKRNILKGLRLNLPYVMNEETTLINIHELTHGIENYYKIGKKFKKDITIETLPLLYEKLYILENPSEELIAYGKYLDNLIEETSEKEYKFALKVREELLKNYDYNMVKMQKRTKKLVRKYK